VQAFFGKEESARSEQPVEREPRKDSSAMDSDEEMEAGVEMAFGEEKD
jgi:hypothetical protein